MSRRQSVLGVPGLPHTTTNSPFYRSHSPSNSLSSTKGNGGGYLDPKDNRNTMANRRITMDALTAGSRLGGEDPLEQLGRKERECEKLQDQVEALQTQLRERPPKEEIDELMREFRMQESLLNGFQRENEKAMRDVEKSKAREKLLEAELEKLLGPHWSSSLGIAASPTLSNLSSFGSSRVSSAHLSSPLPLPQSTTTPLRPSPLARNSHSSSSTSGMGQTGLSSSSSLSSISSPNTSFNPSHLPSGELRSLEMGNGEEDGVGDETFTDSEKGRTGRGGRGGGGQSDWDAREQRMRGEMKGEVDGVRLMLSGLERRMLRREGELREIIAKAESETRNRDSVMT